MSQQRDRKQDKSETEHLKGIVRQQSKRIRQLEKLVRQYEKYERSTSTPSSIDDEILEEIKPKTRCTECHKGFYEEFEFIGKIIGTCNICDHRKKLK